MVVNKSNVIQSMCCIIVLVIGLVNKIDMWIIYMFQMSRRVVQLITSNSVIRYLYGIDGWWSDCVGDSIVNIKYRLDGYE